MGINPNDTKGGVIPTWQYAIWGLAMLAVMILMVIFYHPTPLMYIIGGGVWAAGVIYMIWQLVKGGAIESLGCFYLQTLGALIFAIWAATNGN